mgnify:CR=1 FL=1
MRSGAGDEVGRRWNYIHNNFRSEGVAQGGGRGREARDMDYCRLIHELVLGRCTVCGEGNAQLSGGHLVPALAAVQPWTDTSHGQPLTMGCP